MNTRVGNKGSPVDLVGSCSALTGKTDRRLKRRKRRKNTGRELGEERYLVEQQLLGLLFNKIRHTHALLYAPLQSRPKGNAVQSPIT